MSSSNSLIIEDHEAMKMLYLQGYSILDKVGFELCQNLPC